MASTPIDTTMVTAADPKASRRLKSSVEQRRPERRQGE
jgi:hypothetical protein